ncbi:MAG: GNAT family N-acetyltransferase [Pseudomonadota bacterium]
MEFRPITTDEVKDVARMMRLAFGDSGGMTEYYAELLGIDLYRALFDGERMVACVAFFDDAHQFGSRTISTWGITCVGVDPAVRGRGISGKLIRETLKEAAAADPAMLSLYASAPAVYRKMGFERAGMTLAYKARTFQMTSIEPVKGQFDIVDPKASKTKELLARIRSRWLPLTAGPLVRGNAIWDCLLQPYEKPTEVYVWYDETGEPGGYIILHHKKQDIEIADYCAPTGKAATAILDFVGGFRAVYGQLTWNGALVDPMVLAMNDRWWDAIRYEPWFCRIVDVRKALSERGYAKGVTGNLRLAIEDPVLEQNNGTFVVEVADKTASVDDATDTDRSLRLTVQSLVPMLTGLVSASRLRAMGCLDGPQDAIEFADLAFSGPTPWMEESF